MMVMLVGLMVVLVASLMRTIMMTIDVVYEAFE